MRRLRWALAPVVLLAVTVAGCGGTDSAGGEAIAASPSTDASTDGSSRDDDASAPAEEPTSPTPAAEAEPGTVSLGGFENEAQAVAVAEFYGELWTSYQTGEVTPGLARLTTDSALQAFRKNVEDLDSLGHTVAELTAAQVVQVDGDVVVVCMASSSYQRLERRTGAAVNPLEPGVTEYAVELQSASAPWRVDSAEGTKKTSCREAPAS